MANIVWDIDGVLVDLEKYLLKKAPSFFEKKFHKKVVNPNSIDLKEMFDCTKEQEEMFWTHNLNLLTYSLFEKMRYGIKETMDRIHADGDKNIICTARAKCDEDNFIGKVIKAAVYTWVSKNNLPVDDIYFVSHKNSAEEKFEVCKRINATVMIEDDMNNAKLISKEIPTILFSTDYNKNINSENIVTVDCADAIYLEILKLKQVPYVQNFRFLNRDERQNLSYEELEEYYKQYRQVMINMPYNQEKRNKQEEKYKRLYDKMERVHSLFSSNTIILNPEMVDNLKRNYQQGKIFVVASHTTLDDIQQVEKTIDKMSFFLVKNEFSKYPVVGEFLESIGCVYVERQDKESRIHSRKQMEKLVFHGKNIIILPEGTRNRTSSVVRKFEIGASSIAQRTGNYLVPIAIKRYDGEHKVYLKICEPRKVDINEDLEVVTSNLEQEITKEILSIEKQVAINNSSKPKRYFKK